MLFTVPFKNFELVSSLADLFVYNYNTTYFLFILMPLVIHFSSVLAREKETGMKQKLLASGLSPVIHFLSWLLHYTAINLFVTFIYVVALKISVFKEDSFALLFLMTFTAL